MHKLEVIVTSAAEARVAETAGADRLELVRDLDTGGLTPSLETVRQVTAAVSIPVRVMLRENSSMAVASAAEVKILQSTAAQFQTLPVHGLVMGWVTASNEVDTASLEAVLSAAEYVTAHTRYSVSPFTINTYLLPLITSNPVMRSH